MLVIFAALSVVFTACPKDKIAPSIYFLAKDGENIDRKGDTVVLLYTKYEDPGCYVEDNASTSENIQLSSDLETVLQIEKKVASHIGEIKKTGEYLITYTAVDEAGNTGTKQKKITCKNVSDIYAGRYYTEREEITGGISDIRTRGFVPYEATVASFPLGLVEVEILITHININVFAQIAIGGTEHQIIDAASFHETLLGHIPTDRERT